MRHKLLWAIPWAITLIGCSSDEIDGRNDLPANEGRLPITISTYLPGHTRGEVSPATLSSLGHGGPGFYLRAQYDDDGTLANAIDDTYYADANGACASQTGAMAYWPSDADTEVEFIAIYPAPALDEGITLAKNASQELEVTSVADGTTDFLAAHRRVTRTADGAITLTFRHLAAQVVLSVRCDKASYNYTLTSATLTMPGQAIYNCKEGTISANATADDSLTFDIYTPGETTLAISETATRIGSVMANAANGDGSTCTLTLGYRTSINGNVRSYTKSATVSLIAGYVNNIVANVAGDTPLSVTASVDGLPEYHAFVDLGLSVKWATTNVGADNPTDYGNYFAWGEVTGLDEGKTRFNWSTYTLCEGTENSMTKYVPTADAYGPVEDGLSVLLADDDAATANWGEHWRMPTADEFRELVDGCTATWTTRDGMTGYEFTASNGNSIFLPAAGYYSGYSHYGLSSSGSYWASALNTSSGSYNAMTLDFSQPSASVKGSGRCYGRSVRAVYVE